MVKADGYKLTDEAQISELYFTPSLTGEGKIDIPDAATASSSFWTGPGIYVQ